MDFTIRDLSGMEDMRECEAVQKEVWGFVNLDVVPAGLMAVMGHYGAVNAGAFVGDRMAGFVSGFPGYGNGEAFHHSHMLAVRPEYRGAGIGIALKWAQADRVLAQGMRRINWTFDPLQARNANLNLNLLGATSSVYRINVYGESQSPLHGGIPTDRLEPEWRLDSPRVARARRGELAPPPGIPDLPPVNRISRTRTGLQRSSDPLDPDAAGSGDLLFFAPASINDILAKDIGLAMDWREKSRSALTALFAAGYQAVSFHREGTRAAYRLVRTD